jgi:hypothetical protein
MIGGFTIHVIPKVVSVERSIRERFFSLPWRPMLKKKYVENPAAPSAGQVHQIGSDIYCTQETFDTLKKKIAEKEQADGELV